MRRTRLTIVTLLTALIAVGQPRFAAAAEITVLCSNAMRAVMHDLAPQFEQSTRHKLSITYGLSAALKHQIEAGRPFDVAVLTPALIDDLIGQGLIARDTRPVLPRSGLALAVRAGGAKPDVGTTEMLRRALLDSPSIAYAREGAGGVFFTDLVGRLGLADDLTSRFKVTTTGEEVAASVARGDAALGVLPVSEIVPARGVEVLGTFPAEVQGYVVMVAGVRFGQAWN